MPASILIAGILGRIRQNTKKKKKKKSARPGEKVS
jgi:hypothetical protein